VFASAHIFMEQSTRQIEWINSFKLIIRYSLPAAAMKG
jgi:hypothetical protein